MAPVLLAPAFSNDSEETIGQSDKNTGETSDFENETAEDEALMSKIVLHGPIKGMSNITQYRTVILNSDVRGGCLLIFPLS